MSDKFVPNFAAFRLYEDGTEPGSTAIEAQDTDTTGRDVASDSQVHLRVRIDETGSGTISGATTDDWSTQYRLNGGGSWVDITTTSLCVQTDTGSTLTDTGATTDRATEGISAGTGSFFAGVQENGKGEITDFQHTGDKHTKHVWGLLLISAELANGDALTFRVALNGSNIAAGVVPSITVSKADVQAGSPSTTGLSTLDATSIPIIASAAVATGLSTLASEGTALKSSALVATGLSTLDAAGAALIASDSVATGVSTLDAAASSTNASAGVTTGLSTLDAVGASRRASAIVATGLSTLDAGGATVIGSDFVSTGLSTLDAVGATAGSIQAGSPSSTGLSTLDIVGASRRASAAVTTGLSTLDAIGVGIGGPVVSGAFLLERRRRRMSRS